MNCPKCGSNQLLVIDSRQTEDYCRRRRKCLSCGNRFSSIEIIELTPNVFTAIHRTMTINGANRYQFKKVLLNEYQKRFERRKYNEDRSTKVE